MDVCPAQPGRRYQFRLADVICPDARQMWQEVTSDLEVAGEVLFLSDRGAQADRFAIMRVEGIVSPLIVPVERLQEPARATDAPRRNGAIQAHGQ